MKFWTPSSVAGEFKSTCEKQGLSMSSVIINFMCDYSAVSCPAEEKSQSDRMATRKLRRKEMLAAITIVSSIHNAEAGSLSRIPENFHDTDSYAETERIVEELEEALESLENIY
jgi:hypothetical protein